MKNSIKVFSPASVSNVGSGYDIMGFALEQPGDIIELELNTSGEISIENFSGVNIPVDSTNVIFPALQKMQAAMEDIKGIHLRIMSKINPGSGIGSSAASSAGAVFALNELTGRRFLEEELVSFAMEGEKLVSGEAHADNVAPCIMGGFTLVRSYNPLDIIRIPYPEELYCTVVHPDIVIKTADARKIIKKDVALNKAVKQTGNAASLVAGLICGDLELIGRSVEDNIAEPFRSKLIPGYHLAKEQVMKSGALAFNISGSGPSVFAFARDKASAAQSGKIISKVFLDMGIASHTYISGISNRGVRVLES